MKGAPCTPSRALLNVRAYRGQTVGGSKWQVRGATRRISSKLSGPTGRLSRCCFFSSPWGKCPISVTNVCRGDGRQDWTKIGDLEAGLFLNKIVCLKFCVFLLYRRSIDAKVKPNSWILVIFRNVTILIKLLHFCSTLFQLFKQKIILLHKCIASGGKKID